MNNARPDKSGAAEAKTGGENNPVVPSSQLPTPRPTDSKGDNPPANALTPEEQMALYEKELKETDWGHQPC